MTDDEPVIDVSGLVKRFAGFTAVDGLDLTVKAGSVHGFLGPNGAGKSTTLRVLTGLYRATAGRVRVLGLDPGTHPAQVSRRTSYVAGDVALWPTLTGQQVLDALAGLRGARNVRAERQLVSDFALDPNRVVRSYSKGNQQKVALVAAFAAPTELLILDEPTSGLDPLMEEVFQHSIRAATDAGRTVLLSSHILSEVEKLCATVTIIKNGHLVESGELASMRHLASSEVTATLPPNQVSPVRMALHAIDAGLDARVGERVQLTVERQHVNDVLAVLARADAEDVTCRPASLEELFLRHYLTAAR